jgi:hypothetical protein
MSALTRHVLALFSMWVGTVAKHKSIGIENNELRGKSAEYALVMAREVCVSLRPDIRAGTPTHRRTDAPTHQHSGTRIQQKRENKPRDKETGR